MHKDLSTTAVSLHRARRKYSPWSVCAAVRPSAGEVRSLGQTELLAIAALRIMSAGLHQPTLLDLQHDFSPQSYAEESVRHRASPSRARVKWAIPVLGVNFGPINFFSKNGKQLCLPPMVVNNY